MFKTKLSALNGLAAHLVHDGLLDFEVAKKATEMSAQQGISLRRYLTDRNILSDKTTLDYCANRFDLPIFDLKNYDARWLQDSVLTTDLIKRYRVIPLFRNDNSLHIGITDPTDHAMMTAIGFHTGLRLCPMLVTEAELDKIINTHCRSNILCSQLESALAKITAVEEPRSEIDYEQNDEPVIEFVNRLIHDAINKNVSDIHIETYEQVCRIRFRHDGLLSEVAIIPRHLAQRVQTRLKIMANMNTAERRLPQDGRIQLQRENKIDVRVNSCPTLCGEKIVLRILHAKNLHLDIAALGFTQEQEKIFLSKLMQPLGLILVTGPTGSGKTVTLYSALHFLNQIEKNISSVEDPVEIELEGINQVTINPNIGLDFALVLRSFLRQDPDIIMVGEIRDPETAGIALQAAQTGHLVLSTLHTNNAVETISRLQSMGVAAYNLISSISLIIAQRLVRVLCRHCKQAELLDGETVFRPVGCDFCHQGYSGRIGIFEVIPVDEKLASLILSGAHVQLILDMLKQEKWMMLWDAGLEKVRSGVTSYAELTRVLPSGFGGCI